MTYTVNGENFESFTKAIGAAKSSGGRVIEVKTGMVRWEPADKKSSNPPVRHVLVKEDGTRIEIGRVRQ